MTKNPDSVPCSETDFFETVTGDQLAQASGGYVDQAGGYGYGQPRYYTVQRGDNLTNIARSNGESLNRLLGMNPQFQSNPNLIYPGQHVLTGRTYPSHRMYPGSYA